MSTIKIIGDAALSASIEFDPSGAVDEHVAASDPHAQYLKETDYTAADVLTKLLTVDGAGSGLDADLLDGLNSAAFLRASGAATGATSSRQVFTNGITAPNWRPSSDSTTAVQIQNAAGTNVLNVDTTNARVGIGTTAPSEKLQVNGAGLFKGALLNYATAAAAIDFFADATRFWAFGANAATAGTLKFILSSSDGSVYEEAIVLDSSRNLGVGTSTPEAKIDVRGIYSHFGVNGGNTYINQNTINFANSTNGSAVGIINYEGYAHGATQFRDLAIYDGKRSAIALFEGSTGRLGIGTSSPTAQIDLAASTTARASLRIRSGTAPTTPNDGDIWDDGALVAYNIDATTNAVVNSLRLRRGSSGTPAAGFGLGVAARLKSSTTEDRDAGRLIFKWGTATDATRTSIGQASAFYTTTEHFPVTWGADSAGPLLSFGAVTTPIAIQVLATGAGRTVDDVITALQNLGLVKQS